MTTTEAEALASEMQRYGVTTMNRWACDGATLIRQQAAEIERLTAELGDLPEAQAMLLGDCKRKDALLREVLEALNTRCGTNADERGPSGVIPKIKTELGESK